MHPLSTALFILGYGLALPIVARLTQMKATQNRLGILGHQVGMSIALLAWATKGRPLMVVIHLAWIIAVRVWFGNQAGRKR